MQCRYNVVISSKIFSTVFVLEHCFIFDGKQIITACMTISGAMSMLILISYCLMLSYIKFFHVILSGMISNSTHCHSTKCTAITCICAPTSINISADVHIYSLHVNTSTELIENISIYSSTMHNMFSFDVWNAGLIWRIYIYSPINNHGFRREYQYGKPISG